MISDQINCFVKSLFGRFVSIAAIRSAKTDISTVQYNRESQLPDKNLFVGIVIRQSLNRLFEARDISDAQVKTFYEAV